ncbi:hypothetical protein ACH3VR_10700 [Microbacterium sp. B2969]|uniref:Uncharacterized protein n=1 Tax=Microbacterium alkaliflavum TaxID=3248839 RepID=A0ABW7Q7H9_9MICO
MSVDEAIDAAIEALPADVADAMASLDQARAIGSASPSGADWSVSAKAEATTTSAPSAAFNGTT